MISSTGRNNRGFSLLELMVVIFIVGLLSGVAALTLPSKDGGALLQEQRYKLLGHLRSARAEAVFSGRSLGLAWAQQKGRFYVLTAQGWQVIQQGVLAKPLVLDERVSSLITLNGEPIKNEDNDISSSEDKAQAETTPQLMFLGDGQISPFEWHLSADGAESLLLDEQLTIEP
ncbi:Putative type II secretion system protein H [Zhongshania aliphaticivorans]|uniref:Type II secretion system protein H n=1 Tax=Zhongshania aliphaticivorans TaxID=1470434 RepID=A0A5S9QAX9_9GAMM|nr:type II secretion system minor pseudopilin GspH [Zhongshania aliphaticivorans]CAA0087228.1 Putative type II secretion system protein H [Zhongshania aliphaticivorans]CAA0114344.1 Putative type II secretion system protein H [Zhongshania aliphaticivorans]